MYKSTLLVSIIILLFSCGSPDEQTKADSNIDNITQVNIPQAVDTTDEVIDKIKNSILTNMNAEEKLLEYGKENPETKVLMKTSKGDIKIRLYNQTPLHRANFIMLAKRNYFDSTKFYRVIKKFMIQGGNSDDDDISLKMMEIGSYRIPNEINPNFGHVRGAIAMAVSPEEQQFEKKSSSFNFYIVEGQKLTESYLKSLEEEGITFTPENRKRYLDVGGAPHLDGQYTVFGEVYQGFNVIKKIASVKTTESDWPIKPIYILSVEVIE